MSRNQRRSRSRMIALSAVLIATVTAMTAFVVTWWLFNRLASATGAGNPGWRSHGPMWPALAASIVLGPFAGGAVIDRLRAARWLGAVIALPVGVVGMLVYVNFALAGAPSWPGWFCLTAPWWGYLGASLRLRGLDGVR